MNEKGPSVFDGLRSTYYLKKKRSQGELMNDFALIDEISGLNDFLRNHMET